MKWVLALLCVGGCAAAILLGGSFFSFGPVYNVAFGAPIQQDDFTYTVVSAIREKAVGSGVDRTPAKGIFYVVKIRVDNHAMRVPYEWDPSIARVIDARGRTYLVSPEALRALSVGRSQAMSVEAGQSEAFLVAFDLPADVVHPALAFSNGILMGDVFNGAAYAKARVPLD